ncbi:MAG: single-stranded-DNA-specific exonuclease RecJ [Alphaproteobacteria bacterium]|nr:single-stranded-DNA-specific exonuclease RecJ [Alphaproteobacteria bacterium]
MSDSKAFIEKSLKEARWVLPNTDMDAVAKLARGFDLPEVVARLLCARGVAQEDVQSFLYPTLKDNFSDPFSLAGMDACADYLAAAVQAKRQIAIFGDFDVDGATSSALLYRTLKHVGIEAQIYIPERLTEGYGPNEAALQSLKDGGAEIVILLDCGTTAFDTIAAGRAMGLEIVIVDHHEAEESLPEGNHIINPKRKDDTSGLDMLAAVGVTFMLCVALNNKLRAAGFYKDNGIEEPPLKSWLDIVALGTVCDMVPLTGLNRLLVRQGFEQSAQSTNMGLRALIDVAGGTPPMSTYMAGFMLGPRINAGSRVGQSELGAKLLSTDDPQEARNIAWTLNDCNDKRKDMQQGMERAAIDQVEAHGLDQNPVILVDLEDGHSGLSGLVAGRLKDKYKKPACVISRAEGEGRGSGRSIPGIHIAQAFIDARNEGLLTKGGGHAMAGGFTIEPDKIEAFRAFMNDHITRQMQSGAVNVETQIDAVLSVQGANPALVNMLQDYVGPFGQEHPEPLFLFQNVKIISADVVGDSHIRTMIADWEGGGRMKAMAFRALGTPLGDALLKQTKEPFHLAGHLKIDNWNGANRTELHIRDGAFVVQDHLRAAG